MPKEKSAGAVVFRRDQKGTQYLLLHYPSSGKPEKPRGRKAPLGPRPSTGPRAFPGVKKEYWDFAKGHPEPGETELDTVRREVFEETGLRNIRILPDFRETIQYYFKTKGKTVFKTVVFYLGETKERTIRISSEHQGFLWLPFEKAMGYLKFANAKKILTKVHEFLSFSPRSLRK